jgi:hypothetical protein
MDKDRALKIDVFSHLISRVVAAELTLKAFACVGRAFRG